MHWRAWLFPFLVTEMLREKPPVPDTLSQSQIGGEASSSRLNYTGETRNSSSAEAAWTRRKNTPMRVATEQSARLVLNKRSARLSDVTKRCELDLSWPKVEGWWERNPDFLQKNPTNFSQTSRSKTYKSQRQPWCCCVLFERNHWPWTAHLFTPHTET